MRRAHPPGTLSVTLWRTAPAPEWAVIRWQEGPAAYLRLGGLYPTQQAANMARDRQAAADRMRAPVPEAAE